METKNLHSDKETRAFAFEFSKELMKQPKRSRATVIGLIGDLGVGKTTFTQAFAKAIGVKKRVLSPTFVIMKRFSLPGNHKFNNLYHIDAYRIEREDLEELGIQEMLKGPNLVLIEWADRVKSILPKDTLWLRFKHGDTENEREVVINRR